MTYVLTFFQCVTVYHIASYCVVTVCVFVVLTIVTEGVSLSVYTHIVNVHVESLCTVTS